MTEGFKLNNGTILLSTEAPGGVYNSLQLKKIAALADQEAAVVKATEDQRLAIFVEAEKAPEVIKELEEIGLGIRNYQQGLHQPITCVGELCPEHLQDAMGASIEMAELLSDIDLTTPLKIGINGCMNCCVPTHTLDVSIIGDSNGYRLNLGGKNSQLPEMAAYMAEGIPPEELGNLVKKVIECYKSLADGEETLQEVMERAGSSAFIEALAPYSQDAMGGDDPFAGFATGTDDESTDPELSEIDGSDEMNDDSFANFDDDEQLELEAQPEIEDSLEASGITDEPDIEDLGLEEKAISQQFEDTLESEGSDELSFDDEIVEDDGLSMDTGTSDDAEFMQDDASEVSDFDDIDDLDDVSIEDGSDSEDDFDDLAESSIVDTQFSDEQASVGEEMQSDQLALDENENLDDLDLEDDIQELDADLDDEVSELDSELTDVEDELEVDLDESVLEQDADFEDSLEDDLEDESEVDIEESAMVGEIDQPMSANAEEEDSSSDMDDSFDVEAVSEEEEEAFEEKLAATIDEEQSIGEITDENAQERLAAVELIESGVEDTVEEPSFVEPEMPQSISSFSRPSASTGASFGFSGIDFDSEGRLIVEFSSGAKMVFDLATFDSTESRTFNLAGQKVSVQIVDGQFHVDVDGVSFYMPLAAA